MPQDVAVAGFDGIEEGRYLTPPLTTVIQPLGELGSRAVDLLVDRMDGGADREQVLTCTPAIRQSCGCGPRMGPARISPRRGSGRRPRAARHRRLAALARRGDTEGFIARLDAALAASTVDDDLPKWNDFLAVGPPQGISARHARERRRRRPCSSSPPASSGKRAAGCRRPVGSTASGRMELLREISAYLAGAFDLPLMLQRLRKGWRASGSPRVRRAVRRGGSGLPLVAADPGHAARPPGGGDPRRAGASATERLLPGVKGRSGAAGIWILEPLVYQDEALGYFLLSGGVGDPAVYDTLREQLASALKGALLLEQVRTHERRLEAEVARRTAELTRTNRELTREVGRRQMLEREVLEVSNRTMQRIGQDLHDDLSQHLAGIAMLVSVYARRIAAADPSAAASLDQIGELLADSIARAKQIARGLYPAGLAEHGLSAAVEELVSAARQSSAAQVEFRAVPDFASRGHGPRRAGLPHRAGGPDERAEALARGACRGGPVPGRRQRATVRSWPR